MAGNTSKPLPKRHQRNVSGVFDGVAGLEEAFKAVYPKASVQRFVVHKARNILSRVGKRPIRNGGRFEIHLSISE